MSSLTRRFAALLAVCALLSAPLLAWADDAAAPARVVVSHPFVADWVGLLTGKTVKVTIDEELERREQFAPQHTASDLLVSMGQLPYPTPVRRTHLAAETISVAPMPLMACCAPKGDAASLGSIPATAYAWLDPEAAQGMVVRLAEALKPLLPEAAHATLEARTTAYLTVLMELDREIAGIIGAIPAADRQFVPADHSFDAFARKYGLAVPLALGDAPASDVLATLERHGIEVVFATTPGCSDLIHTFEHRDDPVKVAQLDSGDGFPGAAPYVTTMRSNAQTIAAALGR